MTNNKSANWIMTTMAILAICIGPTACEPNNNSEDIADTNKVSENVKSNESDAENSQEDSLKIYERGGQKLRMGFCLSFFI